MFPTNNIPFLFYFQNMNISKICFAQNPQPEISDSNTDIEIIQIGLKLCMVRKFRKHILQQNFFSIKRNLKIDESDFVMWVFDY